MNAAPGFGGRVHLAAVTGFLFLQRCAKKVKLYRFGWDVFWGGSALPPPPSSSGASPKHRVQGRKSLAGGPEGRALRQGLGQSPNLTRMSLERINFETLAPALDSETSFACACAAGGGSRRQSK